MKIVNKEMILRMGVAVTRREKRDKVDKAGNVIFIVFSVVMITSIIIGTITQLDIFAIIFLTTLVLTMITPLLGMYIMRDSIDWDYLKLADLTRKLSEKGFKYLGYELVQREYPKVRIFYRYKNSSDESFLSSFHMNSQELLDILKNEHLTHLEVVKRLDTFAKNEAKQLIEREVKAYWE